jgi:S-DNA-T family DNA segregation ATPase FtsK/SpoIIIE
LAESALSRRLNEFAGVALFAVALLWFIALVTYTPTDPAWFFNAASSEATRNFAGPAGAFVAAVSFQLLGFATYLLPLLFGVVAWHYFWCLKSDAPYTKAIGAATLVGCAAGLLALAFSA